MGYHATLNAQPPSRGGSAGRAPLVERFETAPLVEPVATAPPVEPVETAPLVEPVETLARRGPPAARRVVPVAEKG